MTAVNNAYPVTDGVFDESVSAEGTRALYRRLAGVFDKLVQ